MLPLSIEVKSQKVVVVARGRPGQQRYDLVRAAGCERIALYAIDQDGWACHAEALLRERLPDPKEFEGARLVFIAGLPREVAEPLAIAARRMGILVNVEDVMDLCDFHVPALVRRGDLVIAVSTGGRSPGLAQRLRSYLSGLFGPEWEERIRRLGDARAQWRQEGVEKDEVIRRSAEMIEQEKWLPERTVS